MDVVDNTNREHISRSRFSFTGPSSPRAVILQSLRYEHRLCAVVAESSFADFHEIAREDMGKLLNAKPWVVNTVLRPVLGISWLAVRLRYGLDFDQVSPSLAVAGSQVTVLLIHGTEGKSISVRHAELIRKANPQKTSRWIVPGAGHCEAWMATGSEFERRVLSQFGEK